EGDIVVQALDGDKLKPELAQPGVKLSRILEPSISYHYWNMQNPVVGGFAPEKIALRRAMAMAFSVENMINVILKGDGAKLHMPIPPGVAGYSPSYKSSIPYSVKAANMLLDRYNYKIGADGWRKTPEGKPLVIELDRKSTRLNSSHVKISYAVFCLKKKTTEHHTPESSRA